MQFSDDILIGSGEQSESLCETITLPSSRPHNVECIQESENKLTFKWNEPINVAPDVEVDNYDFKLVKGKFYRELNTEPTTIELSTESITKEISTDSEDSTEDSTKDSTEDSSSITTVPNSWLNPMPIPETFSPERPQIFSRFLEFLDFLSFARSKVENGLRVNEEATIPKNVDGMTLLVATTDQREINL